MVGLCDLDASNDTAVIISGRLLVSTLAIFTAGGTGFGESICCCLYWPGRVQALVRRVAGVSVFAVLRGAVEIRGIIFSSLG